MKTFTFKSLEGSNIRYRLYETSDDNPAYDWQRRGNPISNLLSAYDTMGDGETQHAPDYLPQVDRLPDVLASLFSALHLIPEGELPTCLMLFMRHQTPSRELLQFCNGLKTSDTANIWVNLGDCKKSKACSKRHDKRWLKLEEYFCGNLKGVHALLCQNQSPCKPYQFFDHFGIFLAMKEHLDAGTWAIDGLVKGWKEFEDRTQTERRDMVQNFDRINTFVESMQAIQWIRGISERKLELENHILNRSAKLSLDN